MKKIKKKVKGYFRPLFEQKKKAAKADPDAVGAGAILPPELFPHVLHWVSLNNTQAEVYKRFERAGDRSDAALARFDAELDAASPAYTLRSCALVCRYWANQCRLYMFHGSVLVIDSLEMAESFHYYSTQGSRRLIRLVRLVRQIHVDMFLPYTPPSPPTVPPRSYIELAFVPETSQKLGRLRIIGPFPSNLAPTRLNSPHWHLPGGMTDHPPSVTAYRSVVLSNLRFPSYRHFTRFIKSFAAASTFDLAEITWGGKTPDVLELVQYTARPQTSFARRTRNPAHSKLRKLERRGQTQTQLERREEVEIYVSQCAESLVVCLQVAMMYPDCPLKGLAGHHLAWAMRVVLVVDEFYRRKFPVSLSARRQSASKNEDEGIQYRIRTWTPAKERYHSFHCHFYGGPPTTLSTTLQFLIDTQPSSPSPSSSPGSPGPHHARIVGIAVFITSLYPNIGSFTGSGRPLLTTVDFALLLETIRNTSSASLRIVVVVFKDYAMLQALTTMCPSLRDPSFGLGSGTGMGMGTAYVLACRRSDQHPFSDVPVPHDEGTQASVTRRRHVRHMNWLAIDSISLQPTGEQWEDENWILADLVESRPRSR